MTDQPVNYLLLIKKYQYKKKKRISIQGNRPETFRKDRNGPAGSGLEKLIWTSLPGLTTPGPPSFLLSRTEAVFYLPIRNRQPDTRILHLASCISHLASRISHLESCVLSLVTPNFLRKKPQKTRHVICENAPDVLSYRDKCIFRRFRLGKK